MTVFDKFDKEMVEYKDIFTEKVNNFVTGYSGYIEAAKGDLGTMFNWSDYPDAGSVSAKFDFEVQFRPVPSGNDLRVQASKEMVASMRAQIDKGVQENIAEAVKEPWERIVLTIGALSEAAENYKVDDKTGKVTNPFRDSKVDHVASLVAVLSHLNITGDPELERQRREIEKNILPHSAQTLRDDPAIRKDVAEASKDVADAAAAYLGGASLTS